MSQPRLSDFNLAPGETPIVAGRFSPSVLLFWLKSDIITSSRRVQYRTPNRLFGIIPLGMESHTIPTDSITDISTSVAYSVGHLIGGLLLGAMGLAAVFAYAPDVAIILFIAAIVIGSGTATARLDITSAAGSVKHPGITVSILEKGQLSILAQEFQRYLFSGATSAERTAPATPVILSGFAARPTTGDRTPATTTATTTSRFTLRSNEAIASLILAIIALSLAVAASDNARIDAQLIPWKVGRAIALIGLPLAAAGLITGVIGIVKTEDNHRRRPLYHGYPAAMTGAITSAIALAALSATLGAIGATAPLREFIDLMDQKTADIAPQSDTAPTIQPETTPTPTARQPETTTPETTTPEATEQPDTGQTEPNRDTNADANQDTNADANQGDIDNGTWHATITNVTRSVDDADGNPTISVTYELTNISTRTKSSWLDIECTAFQNNIELNTARYGFDQKPDDEDDSDQALTDVMPGGTLHLVEHYTLRNDTEPVDIAIGDLWGDPSDTDYFHFIWDPTAQP